MSADNSNDNEEYEQHCLLFPTYATKHSLENDNELTDQWNIRIRGWAFSAPKSSTTRSLFIGLASRIAGINQADAKYELLKTRAALFWASNMNKGEFTVKVIGLADSDKMSIEGESKDHEKDPQNLLENVNEQVKEHIKEQHPENEKPSVSFTPHTGNFSGSLSIKQDIVDKWMGKKKSFIGGIISSFIDKEDHSGKIKLLKLEAQLNESLNKTYSVVNLIEPEGYSVISDIDDTIKDTAILNGTRTVLSNTFLQPCKEVTGMPDLYHKWYNQGVAIHYVSNSPWQLFPMLRSFFDSGNYPPGSAHLKFYDGLFKSAREQRQHPMESKLTYIRELLRDFPQRKFILIGDTGELDPEVYVTIYKESPTRILRIFVRDVTTEHVKDKPAQPARYSYAQTFTSTYRYLKDYYASSDEKDEQNEETETATETTRGIPEEDQEHVEPNKPKRHQSLSNRFMERLHTDMSSIHLSLRSSVRPEHKHELPSGVSEDEDQKMRTPLEMFHERLETLKKGIPDGVFSTFLDPNELENCPIIRNALKL